jgi:hypothetical protein
MPFKSQAQRGYMYSQHPEIAKEFEAATHKGKKLPEHVKGKKKPSSISLKNFMKPPKKAM